MDSQVERLVEKAWDKFLPLPPDRRLMIGIGGIPGSGQSSRNPSFPEEQSPGGPVLSVHGDAPSSKLTPDHPGKTTLSQMVTTALNARHARLEPSHASYSPDPVAAFVPMDGFHLTRAQLSAMPDPATAHARRGAEFTFDGASFLKLIQALREPLPVPAPPVPLDLPERPEDYPPGTVFAPSFDHAVKDPKDADIAVLPSHRIVVFEGNYVALDKEPWSSAARLMDEVWFVDVDFAVARRRLVARHVKAGIAADEAEADRRAVENDLPNGEEIVGKRLPVDEVIVSREDTAWVHE